jgi:Ammonia permease
MPSPIAAILIGGIGGIIVVFGTKLLFKLHIDDVVGAIPRSLVRRNLGHTSKSNF